MGNECNSEERVIRYKAFHDSIYTIEKNIKKELINKDTTKKKYITYGLISQKLCKKYQFLLRSTFDEYEVKNLVFNYKYLSKESEDKDFSHIKSNLTFTFPINFMFITEEFIKVIREVVEEKYISFLNITFDIIIGGGCLIMKNANEKKKTNNSDFYRYIILYNEIHENKGNEINFILYINDITRLESVVQYILSNDIWAYFTLINYDFKDEYKKIFDEDKKIIGYIIRNSNINIINSFVSKMNKKNEKEPKGIENQNEMQMEFQKKSEELAKMNVVSSFPIGPKKNINTELILDAVILFLFNQNILNNSKGNHNIDFFTFKKNILDKVGQSIKYLKTYDKIFEELFSKFEPNNIEQKKDYYNQSSQFDEKKSLEAFISQHKKGGIFQKLFFIPKRTKIFCSKCKMNSFKFFYEKFLLIKNAKKEILSQKLFQDEIEYNHNLICSFCNGVITRCTIENKILELPEVLIVIIAPSQASLFQFKSSKNNIITDGKAKVYLLNGFIENNTNFFYLINPSNTNLCHKFDDKAQYGGPEQLSKKIPIVLFYKLMKSNPINANPISNLNNPSNNNQQIVSQNNNQNIAHNNAMLQQNAQQIQKNQQMGNFNIQKKQFNMNSNNNNGLQNANKNPINIQNMRRGQNWNAINNNAFQNLNGHNNQMIMNPNFINNNRNNFQNFNAQNNMQFNNNMNNNMQFNSFQMNNMQMNMNNNCNGNNINFNANNNNNNGNSINEGNFNNNNVRMNNMSNNNMIMNNMNNNNMIMNNMNNNNMINNMNNNCNNMMNNMNNNNMINNMNNMNNNNMINNMNNNCNNMMNNMNNNCNNIMMNNNCNNMMMNNNCNNMMINNNMNNNMPMNNNNNSNGNILNNNMGMNNNNAMVINNGFNNLGMNNINNNNFMNNMNGNNNMQIMNNNLNNNINNNMPMNMNNNFNNNFNNVNNGFPNQPNPMPNSPQMQNNDNQINNQAANNVSQPNNKENEIFVTFTFQKNKEQIYIDVDKYATFSNALAMLENKYNWLKKIRQKKYYLNKKEIEPKNFDKTLTKLHIKDNSDIIIVA